MNSLLRFTTAGSVDDGKSTLIGRLLYDCHALHEDQLEAVRLSSERRGGEALNLAFLTDGLREERDQGITIDVAYRYFATARRKFIIADTPGHLQYTRNMVTGASTADLALVLCDASRGVGEQTRRHLSIAALLRIPRVVICVNKIDLLGYREDAFHACTEVLRPLLRRLELSAAVVPISALHGDNVVTRSERMPWYRGETLLEYLEQVTPASAPGLAEAPLRVLIQLVLHADGRRCYAGQVEQGALSPGDEVVVCPSGRRTRVRAVELGGAPLLRATAPAAVTVLLEDDIDVARGDMLAAPAAPPRTGQEFRAMLCWLGEDAARLGGRYLMLHGTRRQPCQLDEVISRLDLETLEPDRRAPLLRPNDLGEVRLHTSTPIPYDSYRDSRATGSFVLVDPVSHATVAGGMLIEGGAHA